MRDPGWRDLKRAFRVPRRARAQAEDDVGEEIGFHLDRRTADLMAEGMTAESARRRALDEFGDPDLARRALGRASARTERRNRREEAVERMTQDIRYAIRKLVGSPGFTVTALVTLALAIGATTAIFTLVRGVLIRPLDLPEPERIVGFWPQRPFAPSTLDTRWSAWGGNPIRSYEPLAGWSSWTFTLNRPDGSVRLQGARTTADYFRVLGASASLGRTFSPDEDRPGHGRVAILSHELWQSRFAGDASVLGTSLVLDGTPHTIIGVMPEGFNLPRAGVRIWVPYEMSADQGDWNASFLKVVGRLRTGATLADAQAELDGLIAAVKARYPNLPEDFGSDATVTPLRETLVGDSRDSLGLLLGAVGFVLLLAATNLALLNLGRALGRREELALCVALGAGRGRLVGQLLTEALLLGTAGGLAGVAFAYGGLGTLLAHLPQGTPRLGEVRIDGGVLAFAAALTLGASLLFGVLPALWGAREGVRGSRRSSTESAGTGRVRAGLVVAEVAFGVMLLVGAGLLLQSFRRLTAVDPGFDPHGVLVTALAPERARYQGDPDRARTFFDQLLAEARAVPGVESAGLVQVLPMGGTSRGGRIVLEDRPEPLEGEDAPVAEFRVASAGYFATLGIPLTRGRDFDARDDGAAPAVAVVNEAFARTWWPGEDPLGKRIRIPLWRDSISHTVVGVVGDIRHEGFASDQEPEVYIPRTQYPREIFLNLVVRTRGEPSSLAAVIRQRVWALDPDVAVGTPETLESIVARTVSQPRLLAGLLTLFAGVAVVLAAMGVYSVMAYRVRRRTREIAIRVALGEERHSVRRRILSGALGLGALGTALGLGGAFALRRVLAGLLYDVSPTDPGTLGVVAAGALAVALAASWVPAARAMRIQPVDALRLE